LDKIEDKQSLPVT